METVLQQYVGSVVPYQNENIHSVQQELKVVEGNDSCINHYRSDTSCKASSCKMDRCMKESKYDHVFNP